MPITPTYPGIYLEEIGSGVRTITGVATSVTAFLGRAARGPINQATVINGFADYERFFGGLSPLSAMSFAVRDFFRNGGAEAVIVRLLHATANSLGVLDRAHFSAGFLPLDAAEPGAWGANLRAIVDVDVDPTIAACYGLGPNDLFNLTVHEAISGGRSQRFLTVTLKAGSSRRLDTILDAESSLVRWEVPTDATQLQTQVSGLATLYAQVTPLQNARVALTDATAALAADPHDANKKAAFEGASDAYDTARAAWDHASLRRIDAGRTSPEAQSAKTGAHSLGS